MSVNLLKTRQRGLTLIEILVALLVLSVGLVGLSALTLRTLQNAHSSSHFSLASAIALELEEQSWFVLANESAAEFTAGSSGLVNGCLTQPQVEDLVASIATEWSSSDRYFIPGLSVDLNLGSGDWGTLVVQQSLASTAVRWIQIPFTVGWTESRFTDAMGGESINFSITVPCRPIF